MSAFDTGHSLDWWLHDSDLGTLASYPSTAIANCTGLRSSGYSLTDLAKLPPKDFWGNPLTGYKSVNMNSVNDGQNFGLAAINATDNIGKTIRSQTAMAPITIFTIGYTGNGGVNAELLKRLANTLDSTSYNLGEQSGMYIEVHSANQLAAAFSSVASELLRLAR